MKSKQKSIKRNFRYRLVNGMTTTYWIEFQLKFIGINLPLWNPVLLEADEDTTLFQFETFRTYSESQAKSFVEKFKNGILKIDYRGVVI